jgi:hypothetical protein
MSQFQFKCHNLSSKGETPMLEIIAIIILLWALRGLWLMLKPKPEEPAERWWKSFGPDGPE